MKIRDRLYGEIAIDNEIIIDLINTKPFQRLKDISQYGMVNYIFPDKYQTTRYEHSIGVWNVLKMLEADLETQVAGLLHDVGHTAYSHLYDMAKFSQTEDTHENIFHKLEGWEEVLSILNDNKTTLKNVDSYSLIKNSLPNIGADRFDYAMRDYVNSTKIQTGLAPKALEDIYAKDDSIYFKTLEIAKEYAIMGNEAMYIVIYKPNLAVIYQSTIDIFRLGLKDGWLHDDDFLKTDDYVLEKIKSNKRHIPETHYRVLTENFEVLEVSPESKSDFTFVKSKSRYFDPYVIVGSERKQVSELDNDYKNLLQEKIDYFEKAKNGIYYKVEFDG